MGVTGLPRTRASRSRNTPERDSRGAFGLTALDDGA